MGSEMCIRDRELAIEVLSLYLEVDSSRMSEHVVLTQMADSLVGTGEEGKEFDPAFIYKVVTRVDSVAKAGDRAGIAEQVQGIIGAIGKRKGKFLCSSE